MKSGWSFLNDRPGDVILDEMPAIARAFARCFRTNEGDKVLSYLQKMTKGRVLTASASDAEMRYLEGQRALVTHIETLIERGRGAALS